MQRVVLALNAGARRGSAGAARSCGAGVLLSAEALLRTGVCILVSDACILRRIRAG